VYRDRTVELAQFIQSEPQVAEKPAKPRDEESRKFFDHAATVTRHMHTTGNLLCKLSQLIKEGNVFENHTPEITVMSNSIKDQLKEINGGLERLRAMKRRPRAGEKEQADKHSSVVVKALEQMLCNTTLEFSEVLKGRSEKLRTTGERRSKLNAAADIFQPDDDNNNQPHHAGQMQMQNNNLQYFSNRAREVEMMEQNVNELAAMFREFNAIVLQQGETIVRIDNDVEESLTNVTMGQQNLIQYLNRISGSRRLLIQVFAIILAAIVFFGLFLLK